MGSPSWVWSMGEATSDVYNKVITLAIRKIDVFSFAYLCVCVGGGGMVAGKHEGQNPSKKRIQFLVDKKTKA